MTTQKDYFRANQNVPDLRRRKMSWLQLLALGSGECFIDEEGNPNIVSMKCSSLRELFIAQHQKKGRGEINGDCFACHCVREADYNPKTGKVINGPRHYMLEGTPCYASEIDKFKQGGIRLPYDLIIGRMVA